MKRLIKKTLPAADLLLMLPVYLAAGLLKTVRFAGVHHLPLCKKALLQVGVFPVRNHYYEPQFDHRTPDPEFSQDRNLPGIQWNLPGQLEQLKQFVFAQELKDLPQKKSESLQFYLNNGAFESGDAEYWYQLIRAVKPRRIVEIGSGNSTLMAIRAVEKNRAENSGYRCEHVCVEPYEMPWLEQSGVTVIRSRVEKTGIDLFSRLEENDILFIDSSHIIHPQGDVLFEYLELLPSLKKGVIVHIHDIFSPKNYPRPWLQDEVRFWNEQYLLEAFLTHNSAWEVIGALNYLHHHQYDKLKAVAPFLTPDREPGSFYIRKTA